MSCILNQAAQAHSRNQSGYWGNQKIIAMRKEAILLVRVVADQNFWGINIFGGSTILGGTQIWWVKFGVKIVWGVNIYGGSKLLGGKI